jgi:hypothetical protein
MDSIPITIQTTINASLLATIQTSIHESFHPFKKCRQVEPNAEDPQYSHYEHTHSSHSPWGYPHSWNKVPKVDMHKFDGSNPIGRVSQMEQYFSLHNIWDDDTKLHVGVFLPGSKTMVVVAMA